LAAASEAARFEKALCRAGLDGQLSSTILKNEFNHTMEIPDPVAFLKEKGMTVMILSDEERAAFAAAVKPVYDKWVEKMGKNLVETARVDMGVK